MKCAWVVVAASIVAAGAAAGAERKAEPIAPGHPSLSDARATALWDRLGAELSAAEIAELRSLSRADPSRDVRLAATWVLGHKKSEDAEPEDPDEVPPKIVRSSAPSYPWYARSRRIQGKVLVAFLIDERGRVVHAEVRESIPELDDEALATIRRWRFEPGRIRDKPIATVAQAPVNFVLWSKQ